MSAGDARVLGYLVTWRGGRQLVREHGRAKMIAEARQAVACCPLAEAGIDEPSPVAHAVLYGQDRLEVALYDERERAVNAAMSLGGVWVPLRPVQRP